MRAEPACEGGTVCKGGPPPADTPTKLSEPGGTSCSGPPNVCAESVPVRAEEMLCKCAPACEVAEPAALPVTSWVDRTDAFTDGGTLVAMLTLALPATLGGAEKCALPPPTIGAVAPLACAAGTDADPCGVGGLLAPTGGRVAAKSLADQTFPAPAMADPVLARALPTLLRWEPAMSSLVPGGVGSGAPDIGNICRWLWNVDSGPDVNGNPGVPGTALPPMLAVEPNIVGT